RTNLAWPDRRFHRPRRPAQGAGHRSGDVLRRRPPERGWLAHPQSRAGADGARASVARAPGGSAGRGSGGPDRRPGSEMRRGAAVGAWVRRIQVEISRFLDFSDGPTGAIAVSNLDWPGELSAIDFLRDIGKHFPVNQMLGREVVKARLDAGGLSYTEFSYQVL